MENITKNQSSEVPDLIQSFSKLLLNVSGDTETLNQFQSMISNEIERYSSTESDSESLGSGVDLFAPPKIPPTK